MATQFCELQQLLKGHIRRKPFESQTFAGSWLANLKEPLCTHLSKENFDERSAQLRSCIAVELADLFDEDGSQERVFFKTNNGEMAIVFRHLLDEDKNDHDIFPLYDQPTEAFPNFQKALNDARTIFNVHVNLHCSFLKWTVYEDIQEVSRLLYSYLYVENASIMKKIGLIIL